MEYEKRKEFTEYLKRFRVIEALEKVLTKMFVDENFGRPKTPQELILKYLADEFHIMDDYLMLQKELQEIQTELSKYQNSGGNNENQIEKKTRESKTNLTTANINNKTLESSDKNDYKDDKESKTINEDQEIGNRGPIICSQENIRKKRRPFC